MFEIADWQRYEVNKKGRIAVDGDELQAGPLKYVRLKVHGHSQSNGYRKLVILAGERTMEVFGVFCKFLEIAGDSRNDRRGMLRLERDGEPATIEDLSFLMSVPVEQIEYALKVLTDKKLGWLSSDISDSTATNPGESGSAALIKLNIREPNLREDPGKPGIEGVFEEPTSEEFVNTWNAVKGFEQIKSWSVTRAQCFEIACRDKLFIANWRLIIERMSKSKFYTGGGENGWRVNVTWLLKDPENYYRIIERDDERPFEGGSTAKTYPPGQSPKEIARRNLKTIKERRAEKP